MQPEFSEDLPQVVVHRVRGQEHPGRDLPVGQSLGEQLADHALLAGQQAEVGRARRYVGWHAYTMERGALEQDPEIWNRVKPIRFASTVYGRPRTDLESAGAATRTTTDARP